MIFNASYQRVIHQNLVELYITQPPKVRYFCWQNNNFENFLSQIWKSSQSMSKSHQLTPQRAKPQVLTRKPRWDQVVFVGLEVYQRCQGGEWKKGKKSCQKSVVFLCSNNFFHHFQQELLLMVYELEGKQTTVSTGKLGALEWVQWFFQQT